MPRAGVAALKFRFENAGRGIALEVENLACGSAVAAQIVDGALQLIGLARAEAVKRDRPADDEEPCDDACDRDSGPPFSTMMRMQLARYAHLARRRRCRDH